MAGLVTLLLSQIAQINDLMTIRHAHGGDQTQRPEEKPATAQRLLLRAFWAATVFERPALIRCAMSTNTRDLSSTVTAQHTR